MSLRKLPIQFVHLFVLMLLGLSAPLIASAKLSIVTTTTMITDLVNTISGGSAEVMPLMGPGVDPHQYKPSARDMAKLRKADVVIYNGLHLEGKMGSLFENLASQNKKIYAVGQAIATDRLIYVKKTMPDPHIWFDCNLWKQCAEGVMQFLIQTDPENAAVYRKNGEAFQKSLTELHALCLDKIESVPQKQRVLITSHDAFNYFGRAYGFEVLGVQGVSTVTEAGLGDIVHIIDVIKQKSLKAVFVESSVSPATIQRISQDSGAKIGGELLSDSTGVSEKEEMDASGLKYNVGTYRGMTLHNVNTIVEALK